MQIVYIPALIYNTTPGKDNMQSTLIWGTANPQGVEDDDGIYLNKQDINDMIQQINTNCMRGTHIPVHIEHKGKAVGKVISAWEHSGKLECVLQIDDNVFEGALGSEFVRSGICKDLSMGYMASLENSKKGMRVASKHLKEISLVKKGARHNCHIHGVTHKKQ